MKKILIIIMFVLTANILHAQNKADSVSKTSSKSSNNGFRVKFNDVFVNNGNGSFRPKYVTQIGGVTMGPGVSFSQGVSMGGIDIASYKDHDLLIDTLKGIVIIKDIFK